MASSVTDEVKVVVIDDSAYNRQSISSMLEGVEGIRVVAHAADGNEGLKQVMAHEPDVITLDLEMPKMDGYTFLRILMTRRPTPVIVVSSHSHRESVFKALELGALDFIAKPARSVSPELNTIETELVAKIRQVGQLRPVRLRRPNEDSSQLGVAATQPVFTLGTKNELRGVVCIAASTGGPPALKEVFEALPPGLPVCILVSQHMPASFTGPFAQRLHAASACEVREARKRRSTGAGPGLGGAGVGIALRREARGGRYGHNRNTPTRVATGPYRAERRSHDGRGGRGPTRDGTACWASATTLPQLAEGIHRRRPTTCCPATSRNLELDKGRGVRLRARRPDLPRRNLRPHPGDPRCYRVCRVWSPRRGPVRPRSSTAVRAASSSLPTKA